LKDGEYDNHEGITGRTTETEIEVSTRERSEIA